jgi:hypothetical protein
MLSAVEITPSMARRNLKTSVEDINSSLLTQDELVDILRELDSHSHNMISDALWVVGLESEGYET